MRVRLEKTEADTDEFFLAISEEILAEAGLKAGDLVEIHPFVRTVTDEDGKHEVEKLVMIRKPRH